MKRYRSIRIAVVTIVCALLFCTPLYAASQENTQALQKLMEPADVELLENAKPRLAKEAGEMLNDQRQYMIESDFSEDALLNLTLSKPLPFFVSKRDYRHTEDFLPNLVQKFNFFFCYADNKPVGYILAEKTFVAEEGGTSFSVVQWGGELDAMRYERIAQRLDGESKAIVSIAGRYYFMNRNGDIAAEDGSQYPPKTISELGAAVQENMAYYEQHPELNDYTGGDGVFDRLYPEMNETKGRSNAILYVIISVLMLFFAAMIFLYTKPSKKPNKG